MNAEDLAKRFDFAVSEGQQWRLIAAFLAPLITAQEEETEGLSAAQEDRDFWKAEWERTLEDLRARAKERDEALARVAELEGRSEVVSRDRGRLMARVAELEKAPVGLVTLEFHKREIEKLEARISELSDEVRELRKQRSRNEIEQAWASREIKAEATLATIRKALGVE